MNRLTISLLAVSCAVPALSAQTTKPVPALWAEVDGNSSSAFPYGYSAMRMQQIWSGSLIATNAAMIDGMVTRADQFTTGLGPITINNVTISLSETTVAPNAMSTTFASNVTGQPSVVFQGSINLPNIPASDAKVTPFNVPLFAATAPFVFLTSNGNLLLDITSGTAPGGRTNFRTDAAVTGGGATQFGTTGQSNDNVRLRCITDPTQIVPGGSFEIDTETTFQSYPGELMLGISDQNGAGLPLPFDLGLIGFPTNTLYTGPIVTVPHNFMQTFIGWVSTQSVPIPNQQVFVGVSVYGQSYLVDNSVPGGLVFTNATQVTAGSPVTLGIGQVGTSDPTSATGAVQWPGGGGMIVEITGSFN